MIRVNYILSKIKNIYFIILRKIIGHNKFKRSKYYNKKIKNIDEANILIYNALTSNEPFLAARFGDAELRTIVYNLEIRFKFRKKFPDYIKNVMHLNAGFFPPTDANLNKFGDIMLDACKSVDVFGVWYNLMEDFIIKTYNDSANLIELEGLEPYRSINPWSKALANRKVLVVHPFAESIESQYKKSGNLFQNKDILPKFELITYKTVQTNAGGKSNFDTWFQALDNMFEEIEKIDFDIAIVGCGSYGLPLSAKIKGLNKQVIHLGGATQILFGIRGARWDIRPDMQHFFNEFWTRPLENEKPKEANKVEGGCYW